MGRIEEIKEELKPYYEKLVLGIGLTKEEVEHMEILEYTLECLKVE